MTGSWPGRRTRRASGENRTLLGKIALAPKAKWFGGWISNADIGEKVRGYIASSEQQAGSSDALVQMSIFRMHPWEDEACHRLPSAAEGASYRDWIDRFADAVGDTHAAIILRPDGPFALCAPHGSQAPSELIAYASRVLAALPHTAVYIDVGAADWPIESQGGVGAATRIAIQDGVQYARGIALNTTHYSSTVDEVQRGADVVRALADQGIDDKHFVVNTSSNGKGFVFGDYRAPDPDNARVCDSQQDPGPCGRWASRRPATSRTRGGGCRRRRWTWPTGTPTRSSGSAGRGSTTRTSRSWRRAP